MTEPNQNNPQWETDTDTFQATETLMRSQSPIDETTTQETVEEIISAYPKKVAKKRSKHIVVRDPAQPEQEINANVRTTPGIITQRGCSFAGCKGVVVGPFGDVVHIVHGPVGCSYYSWMTRRNQFKTREDGENFMHYCFTTDMNEHDLVLVA